MQVIQDVARVGFQGDETTNERARVFSALGTGFADLVYGATTNEALGTDVRVGGLAFAPVTDELVWRKADFFKRVFSGKPLFMRVVVVLIGLKDGTSLAVHTTVGKIRHDTPSARWGLDAFSALLDKVQDDCQNCCFIVSKMSSKTIKTESL